MPDNILTIKLYAPPLRSGLVSRPRLVKKLAAGLTAGGRMTLISAPAGYGKTTLALEWLEHLNRPYCWLSLDREDNHPIQFLNYLVAAVRRVCPGVGEACLAELSQSGRAAGSLERLQAGLISLINEIAAESEPFILVLDDYHTITDLTVHQLLGFLIEHQPSNMHLIINTRQDPLLPVARLRSLGLVTEIRLSELRFTSDEAAHFLNETMQLGLTPEQVASLDARTEGWAAGLQLAALSLSSAVLISNTDEADRRSEFIHGFTGDDRHVVDYLMDEVLSRQPEDVQRFLLRTSVLKRLYGPLCDAVLDEGRKTKDENSSSSGVYNGIVFRPSAEILEELDHANLFIIPLDNRRQWYRYHHLFADLLRTRLRSAALDLLFLLHSRASAWYESAGSISEAVDHALLAEDFDRALRLIDRVASTSIWASGDLPALLNWVRRLPEDALRARPRLCLYYARGLFFSGQVELADRYLDEAERALPAQDTAGAPTDELWGVLFTNRATSAAMRGDSAAALDLAARARPLISPADPSTLARLAHAEGMAYYLKGEVTRAEAAFAQAERSAWQANNRNLGLDCTGCLAMAQILGGRLNDAIRTCETALAGSPDLPEAPAACAIYLALAQARWEQGAFALAAEAVAHAIELGQRAGWPHVLWQAYLLQAQVLQIQSSPGGWLSALEAAEEIARRYPIPRVAAAVAAGRARLALDRCETSQAAGWAAAYDVREPSSDGQGDIEMLTLGRAWLAMGRAADALALLRRLVRQAETAGRTNTAVEAGVLQAMALADLGELEAGLELLAGAVEKAAPEGFVRPFLVGVPSLAALLALVRRKVASKPAARFTEWLNTAGCEPKASKTHRARNSLAPEAGGGPNGRSGDEFFYERLSERELEVLRLVAEGLSNPEIAARLYLSVNTLRAHTANIYQKLDVHNRTQAAARARELGLLPG